MTTGTGIAIAGIWMAVAAAVATTHEGAAAFIGLFAVMATAFVVGGER